MQFKKMKVTRILLGCAVLAIASEITAMEALEWKTGAMAAGITLQYPAAWWPITLQQDRVDILSYEGGEHGVVIHRDQAEIIASIVTKSADLTLEQFVNQNLRNQRLIATEELAAEGVGGCLRLRKVVSLQEEGPSAYVSNTGFFCELAKFRVVVLLRNWQDDPKQRQYQRIATHMARSIHTEGHSGS
jgi:hypothetical protein